MIGAASESELLERLRAVQKTAQAGHAPAAAAPAESDLRAPERLAIDYADAAELASKCAKALKAFAANQATIWKALRAQGIFRGHGPAPKVAFLYTGQGSQYVNMLRGIRAAEPDRGRHLCRGRSRDDAAAWASRSANLSSSIKADASAVAKAEERSAPDRDHPAGRAGMQTWR